MDRTGRRLKFEDRGDLVVIRTTRRGARHDLSPLTPDARAANASLEPLFGVAAAGVGVWLAPEGDAEELALKLDADPAIQFAGRGLRDAHGSPVVYTENVFVKFADDADARALSWRRSPRVGLTVKRELGFARNAFFAEAPPRSGRRVFELADQLLDRDDVELCHPELIRELSWNAAFPDQWHLQATEIGGTPVDAHASVVAAWDMTQGEGITIAVIDDGVDIDHDEFAFDGKIVAPRSLTRPRGDDPRPTEGSNHGTACAGVACADGLHGASGVAPRAALMPLRLESGLGLDRRGRGVRLGGGPRGGRDLVQLGAAGRRSGGTRTIRSTSASIRCRTPPGWRSTTRRTAGRRRTRLRDLLGGRQRRRERGQRRLREL